jgi:hypothetical protein
MPFVMRIPGYPEVEDLDFTLDQMDTIERESGVFWVAAHPFKSAKVAKAYLRVAYRIHGLDPDEVNTLTQRQMRGWLDYRPDDDDTPAGEAETPTRARKGPKRRASSGGAPTATAGPPPSPEPSASETS